MLTRAMQKPKPLIVISDAGRDIDDEFTFVTLADTERKNLTRLKAVIANLKNAEERAMLIKGTLNELGLKHVPVARGTEVNPNIKFTEFETMAAYKAGRAEIELNAQALLAATLMTAADNSTTLLLISGMTDAELFLSTYPDLAKRKLEKIVIMGGVAVDQNGAYLLDGNLHMVPDSSYNNEVDAAAAARLYQHIQELGIPTTIVCRHAVYQTALDHNFFNEVAATGSRIGKRLQTRHQKFINDFWKIVNMPADHPDRVDFPPRMTRQWFIETFTDGTESTLTALEHLDDVYQLVHKANLYDVVTVMAAIHGHQHQMFSPESYRNMNIIGKNIQHNGIADAEMVKQTMRRHIMDGLTQVPKKSGWESQR